MFVSFGFSKAFEAAASRSQLRERSSPCPGSQFLPASKAISKSKTLRDLKKNNSLRTYLKATCLEDHDNVFHVTSFAVRPFCFCSRVRMTRREASGGNWRSRGTRFVRLERLGSPSEFLRNRTTLQGMVRGSSSRHVFVRSKTQNRSVELFSRQPCVPKISPHTVWVSLAGIICYVESTCFNLAIKCGLWGTTRSRLVSLCSTMVVHTTVGTRCLQTIVINYIDCTEFYSHSIW